MTFKEEGSPRFMATRDNQAASPCSRANNPNQRQGRRWESSPRKRHETANTSKKASPLKKKMKSIWPWKRSWKVLPAIVISPLRRKYSSIFLLQKLDSA